MTESPIQTICRRTVFFAVLLMWVIAGSASADTAGQSKFVGSETCKGCHAPELFEAFEKSPHHLVETSKKYKFETRAGEACHGPGAAHVEKSGERGVGIFIFSKRIADARSKSAKCLACHSEQKDLSFWDLTKHKVNDVSCDNCHTVHSGTRKNLKAPQPDLCNICHRSIRAQENKTSHHPIRAEPAIPEYRDGRYYFGPVAGRGGRGRQPELYEQQ